MPDLCDGSEAETKVSDSVAKTSGEPKKSTPSLTSKELDWHNAKHGTFKAAEPSVSLLPSFYLLTFIVQVRALVHESR